MAYSKQTWDTTSYVNPTRMNHIEDGIESASTATGTEYSSGVSVKQKIDSMGLCYKDLSITFDVDGSFRYDNDATIISLVGNVDKIIRAEVLLANDAYIVIMPTYYSYKYFTLKRPSDFVSVPNTTVTLRVYWIDNIINKN